MKSVVMRTCYGILKPRLHDTTGCQTGCTTGLTTGCRVNKHPTGCQTGLTTG